MCSPTIEKYGATPANIQWTVVRGDTSPLTIQFLEDDEITYFDTTDWVVQATAYDPSGDVLDDLPVVIANGYIDVNVPASITQYWGQKYKSVVAELLFDIQITIPSDTGDIVWTPVIGTIRVLGDITPGGSL
jgi:hypothetical protein